MSRSVWSVFLSHRPGEKLLFYPQMTLMAQIF
ncbi:MAG: hypothetical protein BWX73_01412 [Lentisphaerae bacterium ADurb.Bin082]|nr:MAG: hypothetical protein BWX73_01412 [Lentisphaerae bacterium ADurb.Bin082]